MGQRSSTETAIGVVSAFFRDRTWNQAELARVLDVTPRTIRRILEELVVSGWPLERDEDHPHVYWSLPVGFLPGGVLISSEDIDLLFRVIARSPQSEERAALVSVLGKSLPKQAIELLERIIPGQISRSEASMLPFVEDAIRNRRAVRVRYYSASRGLLADRVLSIQRVLLGPPARCVTYCHDANELRWFRLDSFTALANSDEGFREVSEDEIRAFVEGSVDGYARGDRIRIAFRVREPEARWVIGNLPQGLHAQIIPGGLRVEAETSGMLPIARFVVGLGSAAVVETPELAAEVKALAEGALWRVGEDQDEQAFSVP